MDFDSIFLELDSILMDFDSIFLIIISIQKKSCIFAQCLN